jgi:error-prone DNA polymerase
VVYARIFFVKEVSEMSYVELQVTTNFSFLRGGSHPHEIIEAAVFWGYREIAVTDRNTMAGIVRAHAAAKAAGIRLIPGVHLVLLDGPELLAYPTDRVGWSQLCSLLTIGNRRAEKGDCHLYKSDVYNHSKNVKFIVIPPEVLNQDFEFEPSFETALAEYREAFGSGLYIAASKRYLGDDQKYIHRIAALSDKLGIPMVATNDVHYHDPARRKLQDIVTCIREKCTIYSAGYRLHQNAERHLKPEKEMFRLFRKYPEAVERTQEIANACNFSLDDLMYEYPDEIISDGRTPQEQLTHLAWKGAEDRYPKGLPKKVVTNIKNELAFIEEKNYAPYFLTVYDIVSFAKSQAILCQGRGSAANSTICYVLGITSVDPMIHDLLFERFLSKERDEPPDIDVDFEHERREEVIQYIYEKYTRERSAIVATVTQQHQKGALRDVAKAMGLSLDMIDKLSASVWEYTDEWFDDQRIAEHGFNPKDKHLRKVLELTREFMGFPRQLGQHTGGFVITRGKLSELCPIINARMEERTNIEWNKDDIDALGWMKMDVLALGMLTCIRKAFELCKTNYALDLTLANIPQDDEKVYDMICKADTIGVFQIESRAQQSMLPRLKPRCFYDLVIEVAIVRPGPIQGDMVHPYLRRRNNEEPVEYPSKELEEILKRTLGVPLFQEQAMKIAIVAAGFTGAEADALRKSMATFKLTGAVSKFHDKLIQGMRKNGYSEEYATKVFKQLEGFGSYGFPESHAAGFAKIAWVSAWLKHHYPEVFACALLNSQPMGFYKPAQIVRDAKEHGVEVRPVDINYSHWDNTLENKADKYYSLRLGFRQVEGLSKTEIEVLLNARTKPFTTINELRDAGVCESALKLLADADAFRSIGLDRRRALWEVTTKDKPVGLFQGHESPDAKEEESVALPEMTAAEHVVQDYASLSLSLKGHAVSFVREKLKQLHVRTTKELTSMNHDDPVRVAGLVLVRQRPGTAKGVCFMSIEDETGTANAVIFPNLFKLQYKEINYSEFVMLEGRVQKEGEIIHVIVERCYNFDKLLRKHLRAKEENISVASLSRADKKSGPNPLQNKIRQQEMLFGEARNFK